MEIIGVLIVVGLIVWRMMPRKGVMLVSVDDLRSMLKDSSKQFIDVRTNNEYEAQHIKEFENIPLVELKSKLSRLDKTKETFVICQTGIRSVQAANILKRAGFTDIINVKGGMSSWRGEK